MNENDFLFWYLKSRYVSWENKKKLYELSSLKNKISIIIVTELNELNKLDESDDIWDHNI